jgi:hypothetical protein
MTDREKEVTEIVNLYGKVEYRAYDNPDLPPADSNPIPLAKIPTLATFTEKIGNTEYTVNAHFNEDGRDLLYHLTQLLLRGVTANEENL